MKTLVMILFVLLAMTGSFFAGNYYLSGWTNLPQTPAPDILEEAKKSVSEIVLPPPPAGHSVTTYEQKDVQVPDVHVENRLVSVGPIKTSIPQVVTTIKTVTTNVPKTTLVDATPAEMADWDQKVKKLQDQYQRDLTNKVVEITRQRQHEREAEILAETKTVLTDMIIPLLTALTGLIGALAAFRHGTKSSQPTQD
jgi:hypothetical protein